MKSGKEEIKFVYNEAAVVVTIDGTGYLVIGDLHIGAERKLIARGIRVYSAVEAMAGKVKKLMDEFSLENIIILGDVKETILYPDAGELNELKRFFSGLSKYRIVVMRGNHDPHLEELVSVEVSDELVAGGFAFMHGHKWPSENAMLCGYIFAGHNHAAISMMDRNKGFYSQKAWLIANINKRKAAEVYKEFNKDAKLVILPAFNDLITGMPVNEVVEKSEHLSPLFRNDVFDYKKAKVYSLRGEMVGTPATIGKGTEKEK
ncbi:MAG: metallophosphoesterase [Candidatus Micrarchaeales archaeon]|nr:metallophosphoesterase [Candidatus Micrarchaeales archaeon]